VVGLEAGLTTDINEKALREFIEVVKENRRNFIEVLRAMSLVENIGLECRLASRLVTREAHIVVEGSRDVELTIFKESSEQPEQMPLSGPHWAGPDKWSHRAELKVDLDRIGLLIQYQGRADFVDIIGPVLAKQIGGWLWDDSVPSISVAQLALAVADIILDNTRGPTRYYNVADASWHHAEGSAERLEAYLVQAD
jgi:hypothetical protein